MNYSLENLGPERFQEICQALLVKSFPSTQCFPVAQPDGGRDAASLFIQSKGDEFIVYQVKYARKPLAVTDAHTWLIDILKAEAPKVKELIPKGAKEYYLLTNVSGTAHLDSGSIDKVQEILSTNLDIPAQCWWRDDINRRLDGSLDIKWAYPEVLSGPDILRIIIEQGLGSDTEAERRTAAVRAYVRDQFDRDVDVRFKQVELQNKLLDLYIDVPVSQQNATTPRNKWRKESAVVQWISSQYQESNRHSHYEPMVGAASLFLNQHAKENLELSLCIRHDMWPIDNVLRGSGALLSALGRGFDAEMER